MSDPKEGTIALAYEKSGPVDFFNFIEGQNGDPQELFKVQWGLINKLFTQWLTAPRTLTLEPVWASEEVKTLPPLTLEVGLEIERQGGDNYHVRRYDLAAIFKQSISEGWIESNERIDAIADALVELAAELRAMKGE
jgi:hypothetical protein